jgi:hypothetical protein
MKALSILQPWAYLIASGKKDIENRSWKPAQAMIGQRIAIHASKKLSMDEFESANLVIREVNHFGSASLSKMVYKDLSLPENITGSVIGTAVIDRVVTESDSRWFFGEYGIILRDSVLLEKPIPCKGALGFWNFEMPEISVQGEGK